ncbi:Predicted metal-dependent hydrolase, TIM-barrel fold [Bosea sp. OK403]|uniref:amidohydrolase family protein n=1 Tax=Bosea sp. OK403 TaxID=1855286 RepID=UPI0008F38733|nr:amidohydrolase family protein [Bosea sp. OK403]SFI48266.1 Predicted metal-dependent hydrolase, TIM-barrel fold [Bosea sp. OK403]
MTKPLEPLPQGSCDCHVHLFGPAGRYPFSPDRVYTPGDAGEDELRALHARLGISRVVLVQPSPYGTDNRRMLAGLERLGSAAKGVAVIGLGTPPDELDRLHAQGVRGVRVNIATHGMDDPEEAWRLIQGQAQQVARLGWHVQILARLNVIEVLAARLMELATRVVIDHFGLPDLALGPEQPGFSGVLRLAGSGKATIKISAIQRLAGRGHLARAIPFIRALSAENPEALVWGSDWPHTGGGRGVGRAATDIEPFEAMDDAEALSCLTEAISDPAQRHAILVDNPAVLYGF